MIPFGNETVTLIVRSETTDSSGRHHASYAKHTLTGCSWRRRTQRSREETVHKDAESITVRVPPGQTIPAVGDLMIFGEYSGTISSSADFEGIIEAKRSTGGAFLVQSVSDNTMSGSPIPHFKAAGWL